METIPRWGRDGNPKGMWGQQRPTRSVVGAQDDYSYFQHDDVEIIEKTEWEDENDRHGTGELAPMPHREIPDRCGCRAEGRCCFDESCVLFACQEECHRCHDGCRNQRIRRREWKQTEVFNAGPKGKGLRALENIRRGEFITEYVGRAIRKKYLERLFKRYKNERMLYIMSLSSRVYIDARKKGGVARYINHSCEPNCTVQRWKVDGILRAGIFASKDIAAGEELSFDYKWERKRGRAATKCHCGSTLCRGTIELPKSIEEEELERKLVGHWKRPPSSIAGSEIVNRSIRIMSTENHEYFSADVCRFDDISRKHLVMYRNDLEEVWEDLSKEDWMILDEEAEQFVIAKKRMRSPALGSNSASLLGAGLQVKDPELFRGIRSNFIVQTPVKDALLGKGIVERCRHQWQVSVHVSKVTRAFLPSDTEAPDDRQQLEHELEDSQDGSVWTVTVSGSQMHTACGFLDKNIAKLKESPNVALSSGAADSKASGLAEEVIFPRCIVDQLKKRLQAIRERCRSVNFTYIPSESKSKQFGKLLLEASLASDLQGARSYLWTHLQASCKEVDAPTAPSGVFKDLGFFGGSLPSHLYRLLVNKSKDKLSQGCNEDLQHSAFFASFEGTQRCTVWVQSENDMGRIDGQNRIVNEFDPNAPRKIFFGCDPAEVPKLWNLVKTRANELERGVRYFHLGADRMYQQLMMKNSGHFFEYIHRIACASVTVDSMTGDHLRIDGDTHQDEVIQIGDWDMETTLTPSDRATLAEELIRLQIELYRDHCVRQQSWIFGRDWTFTRHAQDRVKKQDATGPPKHGMTGRRARSFDQRTVAGFCMDVSEITTNLKLGPGVAAHAVIILHRFLKTAGEQDDVAVVAKLRELVLASLFLANKAQKVNKWKKLDAILDAAYQTFYPGTKFDRTTEEAANLEKRVLVAEDEILTKLNYDIFWTGVDWILHATVKSGSVIEPLARNALDYALSGPVLAAGAPLWLKYGVDYIFAAVAGFFAANIEPLFQTLSLVPLKVFQAAELIAESIKTNATRKSSHAMFGGGKKALLNNLESIKDTCIRCMAQTAGSAAEPGSSSEVEQRYKVIGQHDNRRLLFSNVPSSLLNKAIVPIIGSISAESKCKISIDENAGSEDVVLEGNWRALAIAEYLLHAASSAAGEKLQPASYSFGRGEEVGSKVQAKSRAGLLKMDAIQTAEGWDGTIQSEIVSEASSWGRKVGGKACVAGRIPESALRSVGLRWWIPPRYAPSPSGSIYDMFCVRNVVPGDDERASHLEALSALAHALLGDEDLSRKFPLLSSFSKETKKSGGMLGSRCVALSMQRWPSEKVVKREKGRSGSKTAPIGFSPAALQEMQLLKELHSLIPSPRGHPNFILPVAIALPAEKDGPSDQVDDDGFGKTKEEDIYSLFRSSEENELRAQKEKKRKDMVTGPHLVFHPTPFVLQRIISTSKRIRENDQNQVLSIHLFAAWFHDLLSALVHCHTNHVVLRALQPDQIVIDHSGVAKLAGLYRATVLPPDERSTSINPLRNARSQKEKKHDDGDDCAVTPYVAPENLLGCMKHTKETDIWSVGSLMAHLLLGKPLFLGKDRSSLLLAMFKIVGTPGKENYSDASRFPFFPKPNKKYKRGVGKAIKHMLKTGTATDVDKAIDLIDGMLHLDPKKRITATEALKHEFMLQYLENCSTKQFRQEYVAHWMELKKKLVHSTRTEDDEAREKEKSMKRKAMLEAAKHLSNTGDEDDLYDMDDIFVERKVSPQKRPRVDDGVEN